MMKTEIRADEEAAFISGYMETVTEWQRGGEPDYKTFETNLTTILNLAKKKEETVTDVQRDKNGDITGSVQRKRSPAQVPAHRFAGGLFALVEIAKLTVTAPGKKKKHARDIRSIT